ncbi:MAG: GNAT family N-acetyltransferase [Flavobacteriaceae bacterium]
MTLAILHRDDLNSDIQIQITKLYKQLNSDIEQLSIKQMLKDEAGPIFVICTDGEAIMGIALMAMYKVISGHKGIIEDVIVDKKYRGKGIGRKLLEKLLLEGRKRNLDEILLFSGHHRHAAISLYKSLGFELKESGLYRLLLDDENF